MDDAAKAEALAQMAERRRAAHAASTRRDVTSSLLDRHGSVTAAQVEAALAARPGLPDQTLADQVAAKAAAAVEYFRAELAVAQAAVGGAEDKVAKLEGHLTAARAQADQAEAEVDAAQGRLADAEEIAAYAAEHGDAALAPPPAATVAQAGLAAASGAVD